MMIAISHETVFEYSDHIAESVMELRLAPATNEHQTMRSHLVDVQPRPKLFAYRDYFGNTVHFFTVPVRHRKLSVASKAVVDTGDHNPFGPSSDTDPSVEPAPGTLSEYLQFGGPVGKEPELAAIAARFRDGRDPFARLQALNSALHDRLEYKPLVTQVDSTLADVLALGQGVCQDYAHLMIGVCRELNVPARYVSGYIYTRPSGGVRGGGATHAWCECYVPGMGWKGFDPTNDLLVDDSYVQIGVGRDYRDVPPTKGVYRGSASETITVSVRTHLLNKGDAEHRRR